MSRTVHERAAIQTQSRKTEENETKDNLQEQTKRLSFLLLMLGQENELQSYVK